MAVNKSGNIYRGTNFNSILLLCLAAFMLHCSIAYGGNNEKKIKEGKQENITAEDKGKKEGLISRIFQPAEVEACPAPMSNPLKLEINAERGITDYINLPVEREDSYKDTKRGEWERMPFLGPVWGVYFSLKDTEKNIEERYLTVGFDKKNEKAEKCKAKAGPNKLGADLDEKGLALELDFHEYKGRKKVLSLEVEEPWEGDVRVKAGLSIKF